MSKSRAEDPSRTQPSQNLLAGRLVVCVARELVIRFQHKITNTLLCAGVCDRAQKREAAALVADSVLSAWEGHAPPLATAPLPDREADQLQPVELAVGEVQF